MAVDLGFPDVVRGTLVQCGGTGEVGDEPVHAASIYRSGVGKSVWVAFFCGLGGGRTCPAAVPFLVSRGPKPRLFLTTSQSSLVPVPECMSEQE